VVLKSPFIKSTCLLETATYLNIVLPHVNFPVPKSANSLCLLYYPVPIESHLRAECQAEFVAVISALPNAYIIGVISQ
jgi:hypothetical protein